MLQRHRRNGLFSRIFPFLVLHVFPASQHISLILPVSTLPVKSCGRIAHDSLTPKHFRDFTLPSNGQSRAFYSLLSLFLCNVAEQWGRMLLFTFAPAYWWSHLLDLAGSTLFIAGKSGQLLSLTARYETSRQLKDES